MGVTLLVQSLPGASVVGSGKKTGLSLVEYTPDGKLKRPGPEIYRKWIYVGTPLTPNDMNEGAASFPEFHSVYMDPVSFAQFEKTGIYPDGTVIVKELASVGSKEATSGKGYFMGDFIGLEMTIKDSVRYKDEPGNWGYYSFGHKYPLKDEVSANKVQSCNACHQQNVTHPQNSGKDWTFEQYYPVLRAARASVKK